MEAYETTAPDVDQLSLVQETREDQVKLREEGEEEHLWRDEAGERCLEVRRSPLRDGITSTC